MLSCKEISQILSSGKELSIIKKTELRIHLLMCKHCANYNKQLNLLKEGVHRLLKKGNSYNLRKINNLENEIIKKIPKKKD